MAGLSPPPDQHLTHQQSRRSRAPSGNLGTLSLDESAATVTWRDELEAPFPAGGGLLSYYATSELSGSGPLPALSLLPHRADAGTSC